MSTRAISFLPCLSLRRRGPRRPYPFPLGRAGVSLWYNARTAIWQGVQQLGLRAGDQVLAPAYGCAAEVDALLKAGLVVDYYRLLPDLRPDLDDAAAHVGPRTRAFYVTHYFGLAQPLEDVLAFGRAHGLFVIEDAAHALYSRDAPGRPLGSTGHMGVFSFGKTLAVPDGGALVLPGAEAVRTGIAPAPLTVAGTVQWMVEQALAVRLPVSTALLQRKGTAPRPPANPEVGYLARNALDLGRAGWRMSGAARLLLYAQCEATIPQRRRRNFTALAALLDERTDVVPLLGGLPPGCCPLTFPILTERADALMGFLAAHGVAAKRFWPYSHPSVPMERFPFERALKQQVVGLPIHQDLEDADIERVAALANRWARTSAATV